MLHPAQEEVASALLLVIARRLLPCKGSDKTGFGLMCVPVILDDGWEVHLKQVLQEGVAGDGKEQIQYRCTAERYL